MSFRWVSLGDVVGRVLIGTRLLRLGDVQMVIWVLSLALTVTQVSEVACSHLSRAAFQFPAF